MFLINDKYFEIIRQKIAALHNTQLYGTVIEPVHTQVKNRAALIFSLESVLHEHREKYATEWNPLKGRHALEHLLLVKYKWPLSEIRGLPLGDICLLLQEELSPENLTEQAFNVLKLYNCLGTRHCFPEFREDEWEPELYLQIPKQPNW